MRPTHSSYFIHPLISHLNSLKLHNMVKLLLQVPRVMHLPDNSSDICQHSVQNFNCVLMSYTIIKYSHISSSIIIHMSVVANANRDYLWLVLITFVVTKERQLVCFSFKKSRIFVSRVFSIFPITFSGAIWKHSKMFDCCPLISWFLIICLGGMCSTTI